MIYAEWLHNGQFDNGIFPTWDAFHRATFNPCIYVTHVHKIKRRSV